MHRIPPRVHSLIHSNKDYSQNQSSTLQISPQKSGQLSQAIRTHTINFMLEAIKNEFENHQHHHNEDSSDDIKPNFNVNKVPSSLLVVSNTGKSKDEEKTEQKTIKPKDSNSFIFTNFFNELRNAEDKLDAEITKKKHSSLIIPTIVEETYWLDSNESETSNSGLSRSSINLKHCKKSNSLNSYPCRKYKYSNIPTKREDLGNEFIPLRRDFQR
ncbi:hypothetical protein G9A89_002195 [Geosiphon pyriformis]|nr:hypothetical protein G9A89_002195 [Geosiphon pyriformis]